jgi:transposase
MSLDAYYKEPSSRAQRSYEALRYIFRDGLTIEEAAWKVKMSPGHLRNIKSEANRLIKNGQDPFFSNSELSAKNRSISLDAVQQIVHFRKKNLSIVEIKAKLDAFGIRCSLDSIDRILKSEGFEPLPRRTRLEKEEGVVSEIVPAPRSSEMRFQNERFTTLKGASALIFLPLIEELGIVNAIEEAKFPGTSDISSISYVLSILALKLIGCARLSHDKTWNLDRGLGLFAGLNVLPKNSSLSSYAYRVTRDVNKRFLAFLARIFTNRENGRENEPFEEFNLDFHAIPHWGDLSVLEKNWNGSRGRAMKSVLSLIVHDPTSGFLSYTDAEIKHENQSDAILEFVDFWKEAKGKSPKMLIFDSKLTDYENLNKLNNSDPIIKFITLRRRGKRLIDYASSIPENMWETVKVPRSGDSPRTVRAYDDIHCRLRGYDNEVRQIIITDNGHKNPAFMITNDFESSLEVIVRKYARRWLVEQEISEQIAFFHLNQLGSSIVIKVDFDLTMTLLAHNLYKELARRLSGFEQCTVPTVYRDFLENGATVSIKERVVEVALKKKTQLPLLLGTNFMQKTTELSWMGAKIKFSGGTSS